MDSAIPSRPSTIFRPRTVLCERHELIRFGLKRVVSEVVEIVGEAADGMSATEMIRRLRPDFVILDVDLDVLNGVEVCRRVHDELPNSNVLVLTDSYHATKYHNQLMRAGARGFCLKSSGPRTLFEAIEQVTRALPYCDPKITQLVKQSPAMSTPNCNLTDREIEVLIRLDLRNKEISEELDMKLRTVEKHIECILAKLKVPTRTAAALKAVQLGYVLLPKMPGRDPVTGVTHEQTVAELQAELAIANEHLKALLKQNELLKEALNEKMRTPPQQMTQTGTTPPGGPQQPQKPNGGASEPPSDEQRGNNPGSSSSGQGQGYPGRQPPDDQNPPAIYPPLR